MQQLHDAVGRAEFVETGEGTRAYYAVPRGSGPFPGVLLFQEAYGVNAYVQSEVRRLAEHGYAALAPDLFDGQIIDYNDREAVFPRLKALTDDGMLSHVRAGSAFLDGCAEVKRSAYGAVGFCMGGRLAVLTAAELGERIGAASSFYGGNIAPREQRLFVPLLDRLADIRAELLLLYGADDPSIEPYEHGRIAEALSTHKKKYTLSVYTGAGHAFASRDRVEYRPGPAEEAWAETLAMFDRTLR